MTTAPPSPAPRATPSGLSSEQAPPQLRWLSRAAPWMLLLAALLVWSNSFDVPFLFDDLPSIVDNPRLRSLWPVWKFFRSPGLDVGIAGRPVGELSFALNHARGGLEVFGYHAVNLAIHALAGLCLYGIVRRTLRAQRLRGRFERSAELMAFAIALLWLVHPLQTKSVTFVVQRLESLMGLFYLATLYFALRGKSAAQPRRFQALALVACFLGMGTKEVMVSAPLVVLLHDALFLSPGLRSALRARWRFYAALFSSWLVLAVLVLANPRAQTAAAALGKLSALEYAQTQCGTIFHYLGQVFWPAQLVFDYGIADAGVPIARGPDAYLVGALALLALLATTGLALVRGRSLGLLGAAFFLILAPSSSVVPIALDVVAEHRMYLPLACVLALCVLGGWSLLERALNETQSQRVLLALVLAAAAGLGWTSHVRNRDYASAVAIWSDTVAKRPGSARAHTNYGLALDARGALDAAIAAQRRAIELLPTYAEAHHNLGSSLMKRGENEEALAAFREALRLTPDDYASHNNLAEVLLRLERTDEARAEFETTLRLKPGFVPAHLRLAGLLEAQGKLAEASLAYARVLQLVPRDVRIMNQLGIALAKQDRLHEAAEQFQRALDFQPGYTEARENLAWLRAQMGGGARR